MMNLITYSSIPTNPSKENGLTVICAEEFSSTWRAVHPYSKVSVEQLAGSIGVVAWDPETKFATVGVIHDSFVDGNDVIVSMLYALGDELGTPEAYQRLQVFLLGNAPLSSRQLQSAATKGDQKAVLVEELVRYLGSSSEDITDTQETRIELLEILEYYEIRRSQIHEVWADENESFSFTFDRGSGSLNISRNSEFGTCQLPPVSDVIEG
jgi:hypothetical protein